MYRLKIENWSATDYAHLVNNNLGWVSDDGEYWVFDSIEDRDQFQKYLTSLGVIGFDGIQ